MIVALCLNLPEVPGGGFYSSKYATQYIGSGWIRHFYDQAPSVGSGNVVLSGQEALTLIQQGELDPKKVQVVQEELNAQGLELLARGAQPAIVFCMESKMYAPIFYDSVPSLKKVFPVQILFEGGTDYLYFPCLEPEDLKLRKTPKQDKVVIISSNKQYWNLRPIPESPSWCEAVRNELHTARLQAIEYYGSKGTLDLYGPGWDHPEALPYHWRHLTPIIQSCWKGPCEDKLKTLASYRSTVCLENVKSPGYVTEKRVHAEAVGTLPLGKDDTDLSSYYYKWIHRHFYGDFAKLIWNKLTPKPFNLDQPVWRPFEARGITSPIQELFW